MLAMTDCGRAAPPTGSPRTTEATMTRAHLRALILATGLFASLPAYATTAVPISEPGVLGLLAAGVVAGVIVWARNRRK
jgi:hypothetical protein